MRYRNVEDRLNPITPEGVDDSSLGGYPAVHGRAPGFEGADGQPYTVAIETEQSGSADAPWVAYLVFLRWAATGTAVMGHLETGDLAASETETGARAAVEAMSLTEVRRLLDETIERKRTESDGR